MSSREECIDCGAEGYGLDISERCPICAPKALRIREITDFEVTLVDAQGYIPVDFEDADGEIGFYYVHENGHGGYFAGTQADIDEEARAREEKDKAEAERDAHPDLEWVAQNGETIKVWSESLEEGEHLVTVLLKGQKVEGLVMDVPAKHRAQAKADGIVAVIGTRLGDIGLTAERKAIIEKKG